MSTINELKRLLRNKNKWEEYFRDINDLLGYVAGFNNILKDIKSKLSGTTLGDLFAEQDDFLIRVVLGGFNIDKKIYEPRSLGEFYRLLGIGLTSGDLEKFASRIKEGDTPVNAGRDIPINIWEDRVIPNLLAVLESQLRDAVDSIGLEPKEIVYEPKDPLVALKVLANVLNKSRTILPLYNKYSFILQSFNSTPIFYLKQAYNIDFQLFGEDIIAVKNNEVKKIFNDYNIRLGIILAPDVKNEDEKLKKAVISHTDESLGSKIINAIGIIYALFTIISRIQSKYKALFFKGVKDEYLEYIRIYSSFVRNEYEYFSSIASTSSNESLYIKIIENVLESIPNIVQVLNEYYDYGYLNIIIFNVRGGALELGHYTRGGYNYSKFIQYTEFLKYFAPLGFLGLGAIKKYNSIWNRKEIIIQKL